MSPADNFDIIQAWPDATTNAWLTEQIAHVPWNDAMAKAFGVEVIWRRPRMLNPRMLLGACSVAGIVPLDVETGGSVVAVDVDRSLEGGFYLEDPAATVGAIVTKGQLLGTVIDPVTREGVEEYRPPMTGKLVSTRMGMPVYPGGDITHIADDDPIVWER